MKLLFFLPNNVSFGKFKTAELFFFMIITVLFRWFERFADAIILSKTIVVFPKKKINPEIGFHQERVVFSLLISQTVAACQHDTFELIHETPP